MPKTINALPIYPGIVRVPEDGDDAYVETIENPLQLLLNKTAYLYDQLQRLTAVVAATNVLPTPPALEAEPADLSPRHLKVDTTGLEANRPVIVHLAAFSISEPDRIPIYVDEYSQTFTLMRGQSKQIDDLPAELYYSINFNPGYGFYNTETYYSLGAKHPLFEIGRLPVNTQAAPYIHTFEVQRSASDKPVELQLSRVVANQLFLIEIYRDMNSGDDTNMPKVLTRLERTAANGVTSIPLGNFDGGLYWISLDSSSAGLSDSGKILTAFSVGLESTPMVIGIEGIV